MLVLSPEIAAAKEASRPIVALESTLISHGLPWPANLLTALGAEQAVRETGAIPATIAVLNGCLRVGLSNDEIARLAQAKDVLKASRRDLAAAIVFGSTAGTTVSATMAIAHAAGICVFATGGIGGAHRQPANDWDISADLTELSRTPVAVVCAGAKSILDLPRTLEILETLGVPVVGYGTDTFPAFYSRSSQLRLQVSANDPAQAAAICRAHWRLGGTGLVVAQPISPELEIDSVEFAEALQQAEQRAGRAGIHGPALTPFLLAQIAIITQGRTTSANRVLVVANARLAGLVAGSLASSS